MLYEKKNVKALINHQNTHSCCNYNMGHPDAPPLATNKNETKASSYLSMDDGETRTFKTLTITRDLFLVNLLIPTNVKVLILFGIVLGILKN